METVSRYYPNAELIPVIAKMIEEGSKVTFRVRGRSMRLFVEGDRDDVVLGKVEKELCVGDVVLCEIDATHYVLHRIVKVDGEMLTLMGDGNVNITETCTKDNVIGVAQAWVRKGRMVNVESRTWRWYSWWWTRLLPVRRYLLFAGHPHIPQRWK